MIKAKKRIVKITIFTFILMSVLLSFTSLKAAESGSLKTHYKSAELTGETSYYQGNNGGDHSISSTQTWGEENGVRVNAFCAEPGVYPQEGAVYTSYTYTNGNEAEGVLSYIIANANYGNSAERQKAQAAVWKILGFSITGRNGGRTSDVDDFIAAARQKVEEEGGWGPACLWEGGQFQDYITAGPKVEAKKGKIVVHKTEAFTNNPIEGVVFAILNEAGEEVERITTGGDGTAQTGELEVGNYKYKEISGPANVIIKSDEFTCTVNADSTTDVYVTNESSSYIKIKKIDEYGDFVPGVKFKIFASDQTTLVQEITTGNDGIASSTELVLGNYYYQESYVPDDDIKMDTEMHPVRLDKRGDTEPISMYNYYKRGDMKLIKEDEWGQRIEGAKFHITGGPDKEPVDEILTTDANGEASLKGIRTGDYQIVETEVPPTLILNNSTFNIKVEAETEVSYTVKNDYERGQLGIQKKDVFADEGKRNYGDGNYKDIVVELRAAENISEGKTQVLKENEVVAKRTFKADGTTEIVKEFTRQDGVYFDGLPLGNYYWIEVETNDSYLAPIDADVVEAQQEQYPLNITYVDMYTEYVPVKQAVMYDQEVMGKVVVFKQDELNGNDPDDTTHSGTNPAAGAVLRLTLKSNYNAQTQEPIDPTHDTYTAIVDENGRAEFINPEFESLNMGGRGMDPEYTIPYGNYVLSEDKTSTVGGVFYYGIQDATVPVETNHMLTQPIVSDEPIPVFLDVRKIDADIDDINGAEKERVELAGAKFRIWDCNANDGNGDWLRLELSDGSANIVEEFVTNEEGHIITPKKIYSGDYILYEIDAPKGYYLNEKFRLPEGVKCENGEITGDTEKLGDPTYGGVKFTISNTSVYVGDAESYPDIGKKLDYDYIKDHLTFVYLVEDYTTRGNIDLYKEGEIFSDIKENPKGKDYSEDGYDEINPEYTPEYQYRGLAGCTFEVSPVEDVLTADGRLKEAAGTKHYIVTGEDGHGICRKNRGTGEEDKLFCNPDGSLYNVHEIDCPAGYEPCEDFTVLVKPGDQYTEVNIENAEAKDKYIPIKVKLNKIFEKENVDGAIFSNLTDENEKAVAIFGVYSEQDLKATNNKEIPAYTLIQTIRVVDGEGFVDTYKLPDGNYYLEELYTTEPYTIIDEETGFPHRYEFTVVHEKAKYEEQEVEVEAVNTPVTGDLYVVKVSDTGVMEKAGITVKGQDETIKSVKEFIEEYNNVIQLQIANGEVDLSHAISQTVDDFKIKNDLSLLTPAEYGVYTDETCKEPLRYSVDGGHTYQNAKLIPDTNGEGYYTGSYSLRGLPAGKVYYVKELVAPLYSDSTGTPHTYEIESDPISIAVEDNGFDEISPENIIFRVLSDAAIISRVDKRDMFTGKGVPNCRFTVSDEDGNELIHYVTLEDGTSWIPNDIFEDGKYYYFTELEAVGFPYYDGDTLYELNTEPHKFRAEYDEETGKWKFYGRNQDEYGNEYGEEVENPVIHNFRPRTDIELQKLDMMDSTPVPNCKFRLESKETGFVVEGVTDENGIYLFKNVPYGEYTYTELEAPEEYMIDTTPHDFVHDSHGTKIVVYDQKIPTGDIAVMAIVGIALVSVIGIVFLVVKRKASSK